MKHRQRKRIGHNEACKRRNRCIENLIDYLNYDGIENL